MPRPERPLDPGAGPIQAFAAELRKLREGAGNPKYLQMARFSGKSRTALAEAAGGDHLPTWETVAAFVTACDGDPAGWRAKWEKVRDAVRGDKFPEIGQSADDDPTSNREADPALGTAPATRRVPRTIAVIGTTAIIAALVSSGATVAIMTERKSTQNQDLRTQTKTRSAVIEVQNKVALGADRLLEDETPAYLSTKPAKFCARDGCKVADTDMGSGTLLVATCHTKGPETFNYNLDSSESKSNPHRANSTLWYLVVLHDGRRGYISEVYIAPTDRGGKGLPNCT